MGLDSPVKHVHCEHCILGKQIVLPFPLSSRTTINIFDLVHSDVWTCNVLSLSGARYYVLFIDVFSRFTWLYVIHHKSDVHKVYTECTAMIYTQI